MEKTFTDHIHIMHVLFENAFADTYRDANPRKRRRVIPHVSALHRRWYYSTLIENTPFSPANVMEAMAIHFGENPNTYPLSILRNASKFSGFDLRVLNYGGEVHPIINDLRTLVDFCLPHIDIQEDDYFFPAQADELAQQLNIPDSAYTTFLLSIAMKMKLMQKMPSLYINRIEPARDCEARLNADSKVLFSEIVEAAVQICAYNMRELISLPEPVFTDNFVKAMLTDPIETDLLFERVYEVLGYTLEDLVSLSMESEEMDFDGPDGAFLAGTFMMGLVLDQHFYTPFGQYLKLIKPLYVLPFDIVGEMDDFINERAGKTEDFFLAFFAPCSSYTLTDLALRTLSLKPTNENYYDVHLHMPFEILKDSLFSDPEMIEMLIKMAQMLPAAIMANPLPTPLYTFRIRMESDPALWIHLHMPATGLLCDVYDEVLNYFPIRDNYDFSFFHDSFENRFAEYPSAKRAKPNAKKTAEIPLDTLDYNHQHKLLLVAYNQALPFTGQPTTVKLEIEMLTVKDGDPDKEYPCVPRMSKAMKEYGEEVTEE
ncbi:MAG: hypothetical protein FWC16_08910 [Defluviitaleaceae bacterium]|nr:hypothetical protein [Defluviitaleaceae bacterium]MCL2275029.1 hypothetical protein [Defluviitaleaceae bacterium]